jgi:hypothetical protein
MELNELLKEARIAKEASDQLGKLVTALNDFNRNYTADGTVRREVRNFTGSVIVAQRRYEKSAKEYRDMYEKASGLILNL